MSRRLTRLDLAGAIAYVLGQLLIAGVALVFFLPTLCCLWIRAAFHGQR